MPEITDAQRAALKAFAKKHGRSWKSRLQDLWRSASASPELHRLRNTHGPRWLATFKLDDGPDA